MIQPELFLARHGETDWNNAGRWQGGTDMPLNSAGVVQAEMLGSRITGRSISGIFSSDLKRAASTAEIAGRAIGIRHISLVPRLRERSLGMFEGLTSLEVARLSGMPESMAPRLGSDEILIDSLPGVEMWSDFNNRAWSALHDIASRREKCLVVVHGGVMRAVYMRLDSHGSSMPDFRNTDCIHITLEDGKWIMKES